MGYRLAVVTEFKDMPASSRQWHRFTSKRTCHSCTTTTTNNSYI